MPERRSSRGGPRRGRAPTADRVLFERALEEMEGRSASELAKLKAEPESRPAHRQARLGKRVARGELEPQTVLDLHGCDRVEARERLRSFLDRERGAGCELVLVVHGKGERILERVVGAELDRHAMVAEHVVAPRRLGGFGARLVRLRRP